jgi:hypothetical protein
MHYMINIVTWNRGTWNNDRTGDRSKRGRQEEDMDTEMERPEVQDKQ